MWHDWSCLNECTSPTVIKSERLKAEDGVKANKWAMLGVEGMNGKRVNKWCNQCFIDPLIT